MIVYYVMSISYSSVWDEYLNSDKWEQNLVFARQAWQKLGAMPPEEAMQKYIEIVTELYPSWITNTATVSV